MLPIRTRRCILALALLLTSCTDDDPPSSGESPASDRAAPPIVSGSPAGTAGAAARCEADPVRAAIARFGERLREVSLLGPDSALGRQIRASYGPLVTPALLERWLGDPQRAPGRATSSPWPERIEIDSLRSVGPVNCHAFGDVIYLTSTEAAAGRGEASRTPVQLRLRSRGGEWLIADYQEGGAGATGPGG